ncbi:hypothetical protein Btru_041268 [Bulinus truncatus]|nr:hypothetical protein Btru_041268 [Bulinus truncatus]
MNSGTKEEGELSDDDCEDNSIELKKNFKPVISKNENVFTKQSSYRKESVVDQTHIKSKRRDGRNKRVESSNVHRGHRHLEEGNNRYRQQHDLGTKAPAESYPRSKMWEKRRFRASSVRPLSPLKHNKIQEPKLNGSPYHEQGDGQFESTEDELAQLVMRHELIQSQLKHLEEEEKAIEGHDPLELEKQRQLNLSEGSKTNQIEDCLSSERLFTTSAGDPITGENEAGKSMIIDDEKSDEELRRLALATSERHNRLLVSVTQTQLPELVEGYRTLPDVPDAFIDLVNDEDEEKILTVKKVTKDQSTLKSKTSSGKGLATVKKKVNELKSTVQKVNKDKQRKRERDSPNGHLSKSNMKSLQVFWTKEHNRIKLLSDTDPQLAYEQFLKLILAKKPQISATGTMKDFKRQRKIPVLSETVSNVSKKSAPDRIKETKGTSRKTLDRKSGHMGDNYEEVAMDLDSDAEKDEKPPTFEKLQLGDDFMQALQPIRSYALTSDVGINKVPQYSANLTHFSTFQLSAAPPLPLIPPPPPPPPPPPYAPSEESEMHFKRSDGDFWQSGPFPVKTHISLKNRTTESDSLLSSNIIDRQLHRIREEQKSLSLGTDVNFEPTTHSKRFIFSEENFLPSREKVDYASLDDFNFPTKSDSMYRYQSPADSRSNYSSLHNDVYQNERDLYLDGKDNIILLKADAAGSRRVQQSIPRKSDHTPPPPHRVPSITHAQRPYSVLDNNLIGDTKEGSPSQFSMSNRYSSNWSPKSHAVVKKYSKDNLVPHPESLEQSSACDYFSRKISSTNQNSSYPSSGSNEACEGMIYRNQKLHKRHHHSSSPERPEKDGDLEVGLYEPQAPRHKYKRYTSPPPYIPTNIKLTQRSQFTDKQHGSDSEEDDNLLREKLLATVIFKRKSRLEDLSNSSSPSVLSPRLQSVYPEDRGDLMDTNDNILLDPRWHINQMDKSVYQKDETDEEDIPPPPVLSRYIYSSRQPRTLAVLCKLKMLQSQANLSRPSLKVDATNESAFLSKQSLNETNEPISNEIYGSENKKDKFDTEQLEPFESTAVVDINNKVPPSSAHKTKEIQSSLSNIAHRLGPEKSSDSSNVLKRLGQLSQTSGRNILQVRVQSGEKPSSKSSTPERQVSLKGKEDALSEKISHIFSVTKEKTDPLTSKQNVLSEVKSLIVKTPSQPGLVRQVYTQDMLTHMATYQSRRPFTNSQILPIHPQVVVCLGTSDSEEEDMKGINKDLKAQTSQKVTGTKAEVDEYEFLKKQEHYLILYKEKIYKEQATVKQLIEKAMKLVKAQQQAELKKKKVQTHIAKLSEQLKIAEKIADSYKMQKENTEKEVRMLSKTLVSSKNILREKEANVVVLGKKLFGPNYQPSSSKQSSQISKALSIPEMEGLTRAEMKQKLKEKEKEIQEKLDKLKESRNKEEKVTPVLKSKARLKSQDLIRIDKSANPDFIAKNRRKSLIDTNACTTPNIPMTPRSKLAAKKNELADSAKPVAEDKCVQSILDGEGKIFKMPTGTQLSNLCKLQAEKIEKHLKGSHILSFSGSFVNLSQTSSPQLMLCSEDSKIEAVKLNCTHLPASYTYTSPLLMFKSYRLSPYFRTKENLGFQSATYSHKINPHCIFCPYELQGRCNDDSCQQQHPKDYRLSERELLEDIVAYCPSLAGAKIGASPEEIKKCIGSYVETFLSKKKGKMSTDEFCLWLSSEVKTASGRRHPYVISLESRPWKPASKEETGLSLHLGQRLTTKGVEAINVDKIVDKDAVINDEDVRYFTVDATYLLSLEAEIMKDKTNSELWQRLAYKKFSDPNKSPEECLDQALNVLARGLEENKQDSSLWFSYLQLYRKHPEAKNFIQFCQTALDLAPSYELWFLYLSSLNTFTEKDDACSQILEYLWKMAELRSTGPDEPSVVNKKNDLKTKELSSDEAAGIDKENKTVDSMHHPLSTEEDNEQDKGMNSFKDKDIEMKDLKEDELSNASEGKDSSSSLTGLSSQKTQGMQHDLDRRTSHQLLEMILFKASLNIQAGKFKTALHYIQAVLSLKKDEDFSSKFSKFLLVHDKLALWLVYLYVLEWHQLPPTLYSDFNQNPGKLLVKDNLTIPWSSKLNIHTSLDTLVKLHKKSFEAWNRSEKDTESTVIFIKLVQSLVALFIAQGKSADAIAICQQILEDKHLVDIWLTLADIMAASTNDIKTVKQVFLEAINANKYCSKLQFYQNLFLMAKGEAELALFNLEQFVISHFDSSHTNLHLCDPNLLYCQLLRQEEAFSLQMAKVKDDIPKHLPKDVYMWLCYNLLMELEGETMEINEIFEKVLTHAQNPDDLLVVWQNYIHYMVRSGTDYKNVRDVLCRSLLSMPVKRLIPFSTSPSATWIDYSHTNQLVETWVSVLPVSVKLDLMEMCLGFLPGDVHLLLRVVELALELKETRRAYSLCKMTASQIDKPANAAFWKMAIALAYKEGTPREVEQMLIGCVETMPLAVTGWKDFLLLEVSRENLGAIEILLKHCHHLGLNIDGFVSTISAPISATYNVQEIDTVEISKISEYYSGPYHFGSAYSFDMLSERKF